MVVVVSLFSQTSDTLGLAWLSKEQSINIRGDDTLRVILYYHGGGGANER